MSVPIVYFERVQKAFQPSYIALSDLTISVNPGEFVFISGPSGAGKSTFLKLIFRSECATSGRVLVAGKDVTKFNSSQVAALRRNIGFVFQDYKLLEERTILENVAFALEIMGVTRAARMEMAEQFLVTVGLGERLQSKPMTLSGGEQQRVSLVRALINSPRLILADEPTGNLDPAMAAAVFEILKGANKAGATVIVASHDLAQIERMGCRTIILEHGKLIEDLPQR